MNNYCNKINSRFINKGAKIDTIWSKGANFFTRFKSRGAKIVLKHFYFDKKKIMVWYENKY